MSNSLWPHRWQPNRLLHPWDSPGKNTGVGCHFLLQCMKMKNESEVAQSCPTVSGDRMDCSLPGSSVHGIFRQEYWSGVPLPSPLLGGGLTNLSQESWLNWEENTFMLALFLSSPSSYLEGIYAGWSGSSYIGWLGNRKYGEKTLRTVVQKERETWVQD